MGFNSGFKGLKTMKVFKNVDLISDILIRKLN